VIATGPVPCLSQFRAMQCRPFKDERLRPPAHVTLNDFEGVDVHLDFLALINRVKMRRWMVAIKHADDDSIETAQLRQDGRLISFHRLASPTGGADLAA